jgi:purine-binding chemotaxis protein CheW
MTTAGGSWPKAKHISHCRQKIMSNIDHRCFCFFAQIGSYLTKGLLPMARERRALSAGMAPRMLHQLVAFTLNRQPYALRLASVWQVLRMVEVTPLPKAPEIVLGVLSLHGVVVPVLSMRRRVGLTEVEASLTDQLIVADTASRRVALVVDAVTGVVERTTEEIIKVERVVPGAEYIDGITKLEEGLLYIHNLDLFLSQPEETQLCDALAKGQGAK